MIVTEEEAKTKQCQEGIMMQPAGTSSWSHVVPNCIGSACMAWRWRGWSFDPEAANPYFTTTKSPPDSENLRRYGYCGKAGKP